MRHARRERAEEVRGPQRHLNIQVEIALEGHRGVGADRFLPPRIGARLHVILENLQCLGVGHAVQAGHFIKGDNVPLANQPRLRLLRSIAAEEVGHCRLAAGNQNCIRRQLPVTVRLACAARAKLDQVVVVFDKGHQAEKQEHLLPLREGIALESHRAQKDVGPLGGGELLSPLGNLVEPPGSYLDWLQLLDRKRIVRSADDIFRQVGNLHLAPHAGRQQAAVFLLRVVVAYGGVGDAKLNEIGPVNVAPGVQAGLDLVDNRVPAAIANNGLNLRRFFAADKVLREGLLDLGQTGTDYVFIVA